MNDQVGKRFMEAIVEVVHIIEKLLKINISMTEKEKQCNNCNMQKRKIAIYAYLSFQ